MDIHITSVLEPNETGVGREDSSSKVVEDKEQTFWEQAAADYDGKIDFGPEVTSHLACAATRFWTLTLGEEKLDATKEKGKIPSNCKFLCVKPTNNPIFTTASPNARTTDLALQKIQGTHAAMSSLLLQACCCMKEGLGIRVVAEKLKDC